MNGIKKKTLTALAHTLNECIDVASRLGNSSIMQQLKPIRAEVEAELASALSSPRRMSQTSCADLHMADIRGVSGNRWEGNRGWDEWAEDFSERKEKSIAP